MKKNSSSPRDAGLAWEDLGKVFGAQFAALVAEQPRLFQLTVKEAEALASQTPFPDLVLPELLEEKLKNAARWHDRQSALRRSRSGDESSFAA